MGQYKLLIETKSHFGFLVEYTKGYELIISIPFIQIYIGLTEQANGKRIFGKEYL
jgi:hypothetical protein